MEYIGQSEDGNFHCLCGNKATDQGFNPCDSSGKRVEPTPEAWTTDSYVCAQCGRIIRQSDRQVIGMRTLPFQCPECDSTMICEILEDTTTETFFEWIDGQYRDIQYETSRGSDHYFACGKCQRRLTGEEEDLVLPHL
jgi:DNA-directed RNA polymerase subunit RPC12/RpoP